MKNHERTAVLIDDEKPALEVLIYLLNKYCPEIKILQIFQNPLEGEKFIIANKPDLAFVDVRMNQINGLELIEKLAYTKTNFILTTAYSEYALKAWRTKAINYLLKPVDPDDLKGAIEQYKTIHQDSDNENERRIKLNSESVLVGSILYIIADGSYSKIVLKDRKEIVHSRNLKSILECLNSDDFFRIHRSHIINIKHITSFNERTRQVTLRTNYVCEVSERKLKMFQDFMAKKAN